MLDSDLAELYQVKIGNGNLAVRRNRERFPEDFMFRLTTTELEKLEIALCNVKLGSRRYPPYAAP